ncbi:mediator of RNA polymerase II transcription subunit 18 [Rhizophagus clarus]|uniref:Mediator of RNA polymerase II transcription subunit 18 n=1 Tax=Rhizophagus clarus TaxID=94130 RepID=A0A8H3M7K5_9GLOM|nr:mediator of RNA polymerase II transcription subunit 18 [Rhizophagus clarus]
MTAVLPTVLFECSLHGHISNKLKAKLLDRLIGICGTHPIPIFEHEIGFIPTIQTTEGPHRNEDVLLRLKSPIEEDDLTKRQWTLCQLGHPETRTGRTVTVRPVLYSKISVGDALKFMTVLGYSYTFEYAKKGIIFTYRDILKISITQIFKLEVQHDVSKLTPNIFGLNDFITDSMNLYVFSANNGKSADHQSSPDSIWLFFLCGGYTIINK